MRRGILSTILFYFVIALPLWMFLAWLIWPKTKYVIAIIDKTVLFKSGQEHASLTWVLRNNKYSKTSTDLYKVGRDYFGFFPNKNKKYDLKGLEKVSNENLEKLSRNSDMVYVTDTYGIYSKEWYLGRNITERQRLLYGGLSTQDMLFLKKMKQKKKLIVTEFNTFATPTPEPIAREFEQTFNLKWTGWVGKYFDSFDTVQNKELPKWLVENYMAQNNNKWPFKKSGIAFVHKSDKIVVLEYVTHLNAEVPYILTKKEEREKYNIPKSMKYPFWFDIIQTSRSNKIVSFYDLKVNSEGSKVLAKNHIPSQFPAIIEHYRKDYKFYYFCGDFADNPISQGGSYFKGISYFRSLFYNDDIAAERVSFFWEFYRPMVNSILHEYYEDMKKEDKK
ncbi:hypothetical protein [Pedobacter xixiisoli]|uniref:Uncharacterized protein n=1 Tax=Pedobacter xixiisoli TaxID=1476464 RepID=A0A285ZPH7_9SPHI|nr:hypothetical protein [Pedobacter xixiisoli]SOD11552.1 hypothetical protein SAMN06297358_0207 [Pedobacter xixiisoli]